MKQNIIDISQPRIQLPPTQVVRMGDQYLITIPVSYLKGNLIRLNQLYIFEFRKAPEEEKEEEQNGRV